ncbi:MULTISPECIES: L,D-transpeptidase family protein [Streptomyces]|uniref:L,D-transpeptidase family protein n=1 Tax=Streptomyces TaxID=1883 RepID=UPI0012918FED|nr:MULTISPECIES: L,D-transpeptidase family protein [Streptomyces]MCX5035790.1 L,D-transpeptidase family protein [Streptomyces coelicoflavus]QFX82067.1 L,D-transpeptidase family protein [Streptomyces sp. SYP-A7193]
MRMAGVGSTGRAVAAALGAVLVAGGCTVQTTGPDGKGRAPVRIDVTTGAPQKNTPKSTPKSTPSGDRRSSGTPSGDPQPSDAPSRGRESSHAPAAGAKAARVLWKRGDSGRDVRELQARLRQVEWLVDGPTGTYDDLTERAVSGFQGKRGLPRTGRTDTVTWQRLLGMSHEPGKWDLYLMGGQPAAAPDPRCTTGRVLCVSKSSRTLRWMIDGRTVSTMSVRFGSQHTPTREGVFQVYWKSRHHVSTLYDSAMPYAMFFSGGQAVHYSSDFAARGYAGASHGCVNVRDEAAIADLYAQVRNGDKVVVYR